MKHKIIKSTKAGVVPKGAILTAALASGAVSEAAPVKDARVEVPYELRDQVQQMLRMAVSADVGVLTTRAEAQHTQLQYTQLIGQMQRAAAQAYLEEQGGMAGMLATLGYDKVPAGANLDAVAEEMVANAGRYYASNNY